MHIPMLETENNLSVTSRTQFLSIKIPLGVEVYRGLDLM